MSATIPESMRLDDLLKATGYDCPVDLQGKTFDQATEGGGDVPIMWYLWQDDYGDYQYLPFATAPDTLDSLKLVFIGKKLAKDTEIETYGVAEYTKNSDTEFFFTDDEPNPASSTFTRITEDIPLGGNIEPNKEVSITENGVTVIHPSVGKDLTYDSMAQVTVNVNVSGGSTYSQIALSDSIAKTVGATGSVEVSESLPWKVGAKGYGIGVANIYGKISFTDLIALGSEGVTVAISGGPGELVLKLTATPAEITGRYNVTGEVVSIGDMYFGDSVQIVLLT